MSTPSVDPVMAGSLDQPSIHTPDHRLRVFVSSTLGELEDERAAVSRAVSALRLSPVMFELGARPHAPRDLYQAYIAQSDVFVGLYWQQYGWVGPGMDISGLEDELTLAAALPRLLYIKAPAPDREPRLGAMLDRVRAEGSTTYRRFRTPRELGRLVRDDLALLLSERFAGRAPAVRPEVTPDAPRPPRSRGPRPVPVSTTALFGRELAIDEVVDLVEQPDVRLVTLTGPGGIGKTRMGMAVAERLQDTFGERVAYIPLATVTQPDAAVASIAREVGTDLMGAESPLDSLVERIGDDRWLLLLDNLEQVVGVASELDELLARCPGVAVVATSRTVLGLRAEREYRVQPLEAASSVGPGDDLATSPAVALFVDRARAVRYDFALTDDNAPVVLELTRHLEGLPLAIELAAARIRLLDPEALLERLARSLDALGAGTVDMPERQRTLRATVEWSVGLLDDAERSLLEVVAMFVDGWTIEAAADVAELDLDRALDLSEALARHSLIYVDSTEHGSRSRMLETVREFIAERLAVRPDLAAIQRRHADHYFGLAEQADQPMRHGYQREWARRLQDERGNLTVAVRWYLDNDRSSLPRLFRVVAPWAMQPFLGMPVDILGQARALVDELLPAADSLAPRPRAELLWAAAVVALEDSDEAAARDAGSRLAPLVDEIDDPYLEAVSRLVVAWNAAIADNLERAVQEASASLDRLRSQDEPLWSAVALITLGSVETAQGRYDDADRHLTELRDIAESLDNTWFRITSRVSLGSLALARGRLDDAWVALTDALDLSVATQGVQSLILCLAALARLALAHGDGEQAARLAGAAEGLRRRARVRVWGSERLEVELKGQIREALDADRFDELFLAGTQLTKQQAVAAVHDHHRH